MLAGSDQYVTSQVFPSHTKNTMLIRGPRMDDRFWTIHLAVYRELQAGQEPAKTCSMQSSSICWSSQSERPSGPVLRQPQRGAMPLDVLIAGRHAHLAPRGTESAHNDSSGGLLLPL